MHSAIPPDTSRAFRPAEAAARLSVGRTTIYELVKAGRLTLIKVGRASVIPEADILRLLSGS